MTKTFKEFVTSGNASEYSFAPDTMGEDIIMPGGSMIEPGALPDDLDEHLTQVGGKWALVSKHTGRPLRYYKGEGKPSKEWVAHAERSVQYWKHQS